MSHFTVLVIGPNPEEQLQPFHEYECTGIEDEYVKFVPAEEDLEKEYEEHKSDYASLDEFAKDYYGYHKENGVYGHKTNPNKQWDWYVLGGRWTGYFKSKEGAIDIVGSPGILTEPAKPGYSDQSLKSEIDFDFMRNEAGLKAQNEYEFAEKIMDGTNAPESWDSVRGRIKDIDEARRFYHSQERIKKFNTKNVTDVLGHFVDIEKFSVSKEQYIENARNSAISTFAVIKDGQWYERGEMGWWGAVRNEKDQNEWNKQFASLIDELPDNTLLSVYDCHI